MDQIKLHPLYRKHTIDTALNSIWDFYKKYFLQMFLISLVMSFVNLYASTLINMTELQEELQAGGDLTVVLDKLREFLVPLMIISLVGLFFSTVLQHYIIFKPIDESNNILVSLVKSFRYYIPFLIIMILLSFFGSIAVVLGIFALMIGAFFAILYIITLYLFILPIMMIEGPNIGNTISRTFRLAHKNFWTNIGWVAVFLILLIVVSVIFSAVALIPFSGSMLKSVFSNGQGTEVLTNPIFLILSALFKAVTLPLMPLLGCVLYFNSRVVEEESNKETTDSTNDRPRVEDLYAKPYSDEHEDKPLN
jgi:hypothetical protein